MRVFTFFLPTDTFKKKLELCQFFIKNIFIHLAVKFFTYAKICVNVFTVQGQQKIATLDGFVAYCEECLNSISDNRYLRTKHMIYTWKKSIPWQAIKRSKTAKLLTNTMNNMLVPKNAFDFHEFWEGWPSNLQSAVVWNMKNYCLVTK